ncbi:MAG: class D beta-lactamase [Bacteroidetes bacterium]|jgi:beta-lactamase class D|nr:class D beta-lactamase [Bacteroidota bacterium]MBT4338292.1 class D beta-lactamase [Bacteroidota bacterium]MBT4970720.1 class D beta-lactamase [Bacteroidota bacterium]MBT5991500.1 class D beta-lactamase [Bacteroidota bacterium]MBT7041317.1 class D beta-lactamase [Bacteroidota bacterium]
MNTYPFILSLFLLFACSQKPIENSVEQQPTGAEDNKIVKVELQTILDSAHVSGSILIYNQKDDEYYSNDFEWAQKGFLPASTFKICNSIIALETGVVENDSTMFIWNGVERNMDIWEQDLIFRDAFHFSCVPCYQDIARQIGVERMNEYLKKFEYGNMKVDSSSIDLFWLEGESKISQYQQIDFLKRFYNKELPISDRTFTIMKRLMLLAEKEEFKISGKTGWSIRNGNNNGWFIGYLEKGSEVYFFATNITPDQEFDLSLFPVIRKDISMKALQLLKIIE